MFSVFLIYDFYFYRQPTAIEWRYTEEGEHVRVSCRTGRTIPIPTSSMETKDYKSPDIYIEQSKDTPESDVKEVTFEVCINHGLTGLYCRS